MAARKRTITKLTLACVLVCLLSITPQPILSQDVDQLLQQGYDAGNAGRVEEAESIFRQVIKIDPNDAVAYYNLGLALYDQGKLESAIASYEKAIELDPNNAAIYSNLGLALRDQGKLEEAIASYQKAIELDPSDDDTYYNLGNALYDQGKLNKASINFQQAIKLNPNYRGAYNNLGAVLIKQGKLDKAILNFQRAIELDPNDAGTYSNLGIVLRKQGKLEQAIFSYKKAVELNPNDSGVYNNLGNLLRQQGKLEEAILNFQRAIELHPKYYQAHSNLGLALDDQGKLEEAVSFHQKAIELNPNYDEAYFNMALVLVDQKKLDKAVSYYQKAIKLNPDDSKAYNNLGALLQQQGKLEEAIKQYQYSLNIEPDDLGTRNNLRAAYKLLRITRKTSTSDIDDTEFLPNPLDEPLANIFRSIARIKIKASGESNPIGAGWVVKKEGNTVWIVTNRHVVSDRKTKIISKKIEVQFFSELPEEKRPRYNATIVNSTERNDSLDLAVLKVTGIPYDIQRLEIRPGRLQSNTKVLVIGHPYTIEGDWIPSPGQVFKYDPNNSRISISGHFAEGNSGGPVIDSNNQVIGMMVSLRTNGDIAIDPNQATPNIDLNQPATGGVGLAYRIDVVVDQLREWGIISEQVNSKQ